MHGGAGNDDLRGGAGNDRLRGNAGADRLDGGSGIDWASWSGSGAGVRVDLAAGTTGGGDAEGDALSAIENLAGSGHDDVLRGDGEVNVLSGLAGADTLYGNGGDDVLEGGAGADRLDGGAGIDTARYLGSDAGVNVLLFYAGHANDGGHAEGDVLVNIENVTGSAYNDYLEGNDAVNHLAGGPGDDTLVGRAGADRLDGGPGEDLADYSDADTGVTVDLGKGSGAGGEARGDVIINVEDVRGSAYRDLLIGDGAGNRLIGGDGDDDLRGGGGDDLLQGGVGADRLDGGAGDDLLEYLDSDAGVTVNLQQGSFRGGYAEGDVVTGVEGVFGSGYADALTGDDQANQLFGYDGEDEIHGNGGDDWLFGGAANDRIFGDKGDDRLSGDEGNDSLHGGEGDDSLNGGDGDDRLTAGAGDDLLTGGVGADRLDGGAGNDRLSGNNTEAPGADGDVDVFIFDAGHGADIIFDFADGEDKIDLSAFVLAGFEALDLSFDDDGTTIDLSVHEGGTILLVAFDIANLDATDFLV